MGLGAKDCARFHSDATELAGVISHSVRSFLGSAILLYERPAFARKSRDGKRLQYRRKMAHRLISLDQIQHPL